MFIGRNFTVHGDKYVDVGIQLSGRTWVTFQVQTSKDATVGLFPYFGWMNLSYEFVIGAGNNTYATIRYSILTRNKTNKKLKKRKISSKVCRQLQLETSMGLSVPVSIERANPC